MNIFGVLMLTFKTNKLKGEYISSHGKFLENTFDLKNF